MSHSVAVVRRICMKSKSAQADVIVIGAGYAGVTAANRLAARRHRVILVNPTDQFVDRIRLHEVVAGTRATAARPLAKMVRSSVQRIEGRVACVGADAGPPAGGVQLADGGQLEDGVQLEDGRTLSAAHILWAGGSAPRTSQPGWLPVGSPDFALAARRRIASLPAGAAVTVVGGGLTGIETASEIAERRPDLRVVLADPRGPASRLDERARTRISETLESFGVRLTVEPVDSDAVASDPFDSDAVEPVDGGVVLDCTGFSPVQPGIAGEWTTDEYLRLPGGRQWWGAGDGVGVATMTHQRMGCAVALPMAVVAADNIDAAIRGREPRAFDFGFLFQCISLGRRDGAIVWVNRDDTPTGRVWTGRRAAVTKEMICRMAVTAARTGGRLYGWPKGPK